MKKSEPIIEFFSDDELQDYLKFWQDKLFLNDWIIKAKLVSIGETNIEEVAAENEFQFVNKTSIIRIVKNIPNDRIMKACQEKTLIHELLHLKMIYDYNQENTIANSLFCNTQHQLIEEMAKSLMMVKYDLAFNWFNNIREEQIV